MVPALKLLSGGSLTFLFAVLSSVSLNSTSLNFAYEACQCPIPGIAHSVLRFSTYEPIN